MNILISTLALLVLVAPSIIFAQTPTPTSLINLPVSPQPGTGGFSGYINLLYGLSISVAALLAVIKIIIAGVKYMLTDVVTSKGEAIKEIKGALLGLLLIIGAVLILIVINPKLLDATLKFNPQPMPNVKVATSSSPVIATGGPITSNNTPPTGSPLASADTTCQNSVNAQYANAAPQTKQYYYNVCMTNAKSKLQTDCESVYGKYDGNTGSCQKPIATRPMSSFTAEFEAYKATLPANDYAGRGATTPSLAVEKQLCTNWGGTFYDDWGPNNTCLKY